MKPEQKIEPGTPRVEKKYCIVIDKEGPYFVYGNPPLQQEFIVPNEAGESWEYKQGIRFNMEEEPVALCRCGHSRCKPFCDGSHTKEEWDATLTAHPAPLLEEAEVFDGPGYQLIDNPTYCVHARFCMAKNTSWRLIRESGQEEVRELLRHEVFNCPSGRLKIWDKNSETYLEPELTPSLSLIEDPQKECSGPLWVKGGIPIEDCSGNCYEIRNRVTLCRCGKSKNKPFCDGEHMEEQKFTDELPSS